MLEWFIIMVAALCVAIPIAGPVLALVTVFGLLLYRQDSPKITKKALWQSEPNVYIRYAIVLVFTIFVSLCLHSTYLLALLF